MELRGRKLVLLVADQYQDEEVSQPLAFFRERGAEVVVAGIAKGKARGKYGRHSIDVDTLVSELDPRAFDALLIPGGSAPERLRLHDEVLEFTRAFFREGKVVGAICHGPQVLISAGVLRGRHVTCYEGIRDDVRLAGAHYEDREVIVDGGLVTSRKPADIPAFTEAILRLLVEPAGAVVQPQNLATESA